MATYSFETITEEQALALTAADVLTLAAGATNQVTVLYGPATPEAPDGVISVIMAGRSVTFTPVLATLSLNGRLQVADGSRLLIGDASANTATGTALSDALYGGDGADSLSAGDGDDLVQGNQGADTLDGGAGRDVIYGGQDNDRILTGEGLDFAQGNKGNDSILGGNSSDTLLGGQGADTIDGAGGDEFINGNLGDDFIVSHGGNDRLYGEGGDDRLDAGYGADFVDGGDGHDQIFAQLGANTLLGGAGNDTVTSYSATASTVRGGDGDDLVRGAGSVFGDAGDDTLVSQYGPTFLDGGAGNDLIKGSVGGYNLSDTMVGGDGADTLAGLNDRDVLSGGAGSDLFRNYGGDANTFVNSLIELERIADWSSEDRFQFLIEYLPTGEYRAFAGTASNYAEASATDYAAAKALATGQMQAGKLYVAVQVGSDVVVFVDGYQNDGVSDAVRLVGRSLSDIDASNFIGGEAR